jgi:formylglycine-generating enzyme required for sulfatase activity
MKPWLLAILLLIVSTTIPANEFTVWLPGNVPLDLVKVPAGTFMMGSPEGERGNFLDNETQHQVTLTRDYYLGKTEVTQRQWQAVMGTPMPSIHDGCHLSDNLFNQLAPYLPVYCVSWNSINGPGGFIEKLNDALETDVFRLPSEAEWERAARADTTTRFSHGDALECSDECIWCSTHSQYMMWCGNGDIACLELDWRDLNQCLRYGLSWPYRVDSRKANPFGLHDMHGNLWEFVNDRYGDFSRASVIDPEGPGGSGDVVIRGGGAGEAHLSRSASRLKSAPDNRGRSDQVGFRIAASHLDGLAFEINNGLNDAWYDPAIDGQGFLISVFPVIQQMFVAWFTYDTERPPDDVEAILGEPGHRWLTAQGPYAGDTATLSIYLTQGGVFDAAAPPASNDGIADGTMTIEFTDCTEGLVIYELTSPSISGTVPIQRITNDNVSLCEVLSGQQ